jgi:hypothetical protein
MFHIPQVEALQFQSYGKQGWNNQVDSGQYMLHNCCTGPLKPIPRNNCNYQIIHNCIHNQNIDFYYLNIFFALVAVSSSFTRKSNYKLN